MCVVFIYKYCYDILYKGLEHPRKVPEFHKSIYFCFIDYANVFDCVDHNKLWKKRWEYQTT